MVGRRIIFLLIIGALALPASASADSLVVPSTKVTSLSEAEGRFVWVRDGVSGDRITTDLTGTATDLNTVTRPTVTRVAFDKVTGSRHAEAVYTRCTSGFGACDLYQYDLVTGAHGKVSGAASSRCSEHSPSISDGVIVYGRNGPGCRPGLYVKRPGAKPRLIAKANHVTATDILGDRVVYVNEQPLEGATYYRLRRINLHTGKTCSVRNLYTDAAGEGGRITAVQYSYAAIYWSQTNDTAETSTIAKAAGCRKSSDRPLGLRVSTRSFGYFALDSFAVDEAGAVYYGSNEGIRRIDEPAPF